MRGATIPDVVTIKDPLLRAIAELREQIDRVLDEQKSVLSGFLAVLNEEADAPDRSHPATGPAAAIAVHAEPAAVAPTIGLAPEPPTKGRRSAATPAFDRVDPPSQTPPRPGVASVSEAVASGRPDSARDRLDALAKHLDRKLRQANTAAGEPAA